MALRPLKICATLFIKLRKKANLGDKVGLLLFPLVIRADIQLDSRIVNIIISR